jgi:dihydrofolate reductase
VEPPALGIIPAMPTAKGRTQDPPPRKVTVGLGTSLDHFIARKDGSFDWLSYSEEVAEVSRAYWKTIDTVLMGRKTFECGSYSFPGVKTFVFSRTLRVDPGPGVEIVPEDAGEFVLRLKGRRGKGICVFGGGELTSSLLRAGAIDELVLNIHPVLLGSGIPLFHGMEAPLELELSDCRRLRNGCVVVTHRVKR